jgi:hypothetical protein
MQHWIISHNIYYLSISNHLDGGVCITVDKMIAASKWEKDQIREFHAPFPQVFQAVIACSDDMVRLSDLFPPDLCGHKFCNFPQSS